MTPRLKTDQTAKPQRGDAPTIEVIGGSAHAAIAKYPEQFERSIVIVVDAADEVDSLRVHWKGRDNAVLWPLADTKTTKELLRDHGTTAQQKAFEQLPNISPVDGLSQIRAVGECAVAELLADSDFVEAMRDAALELNRLAGGNLNRIHIVARCGITGGAGSKGIRLFVVWLLHMFVRETALPVHLDVHLLGAITFQAKGFERTKPNGGCAVLEWAEETTGSDKITITVFAQEAPPVQYDRKRRDNMVLQQQTAFRCTGISELLRQDRSNRAGASSYGNIHVPRTTYFRDLDAARVRSDLATTYLPPIEALLETRPLSGYIEGIRFFDTDVTDPIDIEELINRLQRVGDDEELADELRQAFVAGKRDGIFDVSNDQKLTLSKVVESYAGAVLSPKQLETRLGVLMAIHEAVNASIIERRSEREEFLRREVELLSNAIDAMFGYYDRFSWQNARRRFQIACEAVEDYRDISIELQQIDNELELLSSVGKDIRQQIDTQLSRLHSLHRCLSECLLSGEEHITEPFVVARPFNDVLARLLRSTEMIDLNSPEFGQTLLRCAGEITLSGVATMVGAESATVESVLTAIERGSAAVASPFWGAKVRRDTADRYVVFPPMKSEDQRALSRHFAEREISGEVCFSPLTSPTRNVVLVELRTCRRLEDFLTTFYQLGVKQAAGRADSALFLDDPALALKRIESLNAHPTQNQPSEKTR